MNEQLAERYRTIRSTGCPARFAFAQAKAPDSPRIALSEPKGRSKAMLVGEAVVSGFSVGVSVVQDETLEMEDRVGWIAADMKKAIDLFRRREGLSKDGACLLRRIPVPWRRQRSFGIGGSMTAPPTLPIVKIDGHAGFFVPPENADNLVDSYWSCGCSRAEADRLARAQTYRSLKRLRELHADQWCFVDVVAKASVAGVELAQVYVGGLESDDLPGMESAAYEAALSCVADAREKLREVVAAARVIAEEEGP